MFCTVCRKDLKGIDYNSSIGELPGNRKVKVLLCEKCFIERRDNNKIPFDEYFGDLYAN